MASILEFNTLPLTVRCRDNDLKELEKRDASERVRPDSFYNVEQRYDIYGRLQFAMPILQAGAVLLTQNRKEEDGFGNLREMRMTITPRAIEDAAYTMNGAPVTEDHPRDSRGAILGPEEFGRFELGMVRAVAFDGVFMYGFMLITDRDYARKLKGARNLSASIGMNSMDFEADIYGDMRAMGAPTDIVVNSMQFDHVAVWEQTNSSGQPAIPTARLSNDAIGDAVQFKEIHDLDWMFSSFKKEKQPEGERR